MKQTEQCHLEIYYICIIYVEIKILLCFTVLFIYFKLCIYCWTGWTFVRANFAHSATCTACCSKSKDTSEHVSNKQITLFPVLLQATDLPPPLPEANDPLPQARMQLVESPHHPVLIYDYGLPESTAGQAKLKRWNAGEPPVMRAKLPTERQVFTAPAPVQFQQFVQPQPLPLWQETSVASVVQTFTSAPPQSSNQEPPLTPAPTPLPHHIL